MTRARIWSLAWAGWLAATLGSFAWLETVALRRHAHPTLTRTLRRWLELDRHARELSRNAADLARDARLENQLEQVDQQHHDPGRGGHG